MSEAGDRTHASGASAAWRGYALASFAILVLLLVFFQAMVFRDREPVSGDTAAAEAYRAWSESRLAENARTPLWYPDIFLGMPSYGSFIYTPGSPLSFLHRALHMNRGSRYVLWLFIGGLGTLALARRLGAGAWAALAATLAVVFTPYAIGSINAGHSSKLMALAFAPVVFWSVERLLAERDVLSLSLASGSIALQLWSNHPQIVFYTWLLLAPYALIRLWKSPDGRRRAVVLLAGSVAIAALMIALPYLPVLDYARHSTRGAATVLRDHAASGTQSWAYATAWSFNPKELISFVVPAAFGLEGERYWGPMPFTQSTHAMGIVPLLLAIVGFSLMRGWRRAYFLVAIAAVLLIGFGRHLPVLYRPLYELMPHFDKFRVPSMIYAMLPLLVLPAVAIGFEGLGARGARTSSRRLESVLLTLAVIVALVGVLVLAGAGSGLADFRKPGESPSPGLVEERRSLLGADALRVGVLGVLLLIAARLRRAGRLAPAAFAISVIALLVVDLATLDRQFYDPRPRAVLSDLGPDPALAERILEGGRPVRVLPLELSVSGGRLVPDLQQGSEYALARIQSVGGYHPAGLRLVKDFILAGLFGNPALWPMLDVAFVPVHLRARLDETQREALAEALQAEFPSLEPVTNVSDHRGEVFLFRAPGSLGRAFVVPEATVIGDPLDRMARLADRTFDPTREVLLERESVRSGPPPDSTWRARARVLTYQDERLEVGVEGDGGYLVIADAHHPGWRATIDGDRAEVVPANHVLRALAIPPGTHTVELVFHDDAFASARALSYGGKALFLASLATGLALSRRSRRTAPSLAAPP